jgi:hypothetical protein
MQPIYGRNDIAFHLALGIQPFIVHLSCWFRSITSALLPLGALEHQREMLILSELLRFFFELNFPELEFMSELRSHEFENSVSQKHLFLLLL